MQNGIFLLSVRRRGQIYILWKNLRKILILYTLSLNANEFLTLLYLSTSDFSWYIATSDVKQVEMRFGAPVEI